MAEVFNALVWGVLNGLLSAPPKDTARATRDTARATRANGPKVNSANLLRALARNAHPSNRVPFENPVTC
jgi:hypothetical protein